MVSKIKKVIHELKHHYPFTLAATLIAVIGVITLYNFRDMNFVSLIKTSFEIAHPMHIFVSAITSAAMFYKYKKSVIKAIIVGLVATIVVGSLSDIIFPFLGGIILGLKMEFHLPIIEEPLLILSVALIGSLAGIKLLITKIPHLLHVFISVFASLFYIIAYGGAITPLVFALAFIIVFFSVIIPCCTSDIILPFLFMKEKIKHC